MVEHQGERVAELSVSAGVAGTHGAYVAPALLMRAADGALYQAKRQGRNRVAVAGAGP